MGGKDEMINFGKQRIQTRARSGWGFSNDAASSVKRAKEFALLIKAIPDFFGQRVRGKIIKTADTDGVGRGRARSRPERGAPRMTGQDRDVVIIEIRIYPGQRQDVLTAVAPVKPDPVRITCLPPR